MNSQVAQVIGAIVLLAIMGVGAGIYAANHGLDNAPDARLTQAIDAAIAGAAPDGDTITWSTHTIDQSQMTDSSTDPDAHTYVVVTDAGNNVQTFDLGVPVTIDGLTSGSIIVGSNGFATFNAASPSNPSGSADTSLPVVLPNRTRTITLSPLAVTP